MLVGSVETLLIVICSLQKCEVHVLQSRSVETKAKTNISFIHFFIFCRKAQTIDFYDIFNFRTALQSYSVAPDYPGRLCTSSPGTLVYTSCQRNKQVVKWLDCRNFPPNTMTTNIQMPYAGNHFIQDMCCTTHKEKDLLVTTHSFGGVHAYIAGTDELEWRVSGRQPGMLSLINAVGITANGQGQLFFCDTSNGCIHMLSTEGIFLPPAYVVRREGTVFTGVCLSTGGGGVPWQVQPGGAGGYPGGGGRGDTLAGGGGGVPWPGGYPGRGGWGGTLAGGAGGVPWPGGVGGTLAGGGTLARGGYPVRTT